MVTARERRRLILCLLLAATVGALTSLAYLWQLIPGASHLQNQVTDATIFRHREGNRARRVVLVHIDEKSVAALGESYGRVFSWPRSLHAQVLRSLAEAGARVVVYDLLFDAPGCAVSLPAPCQEDITFAAAIDEAMNAARTRPGPGTQVLLPLAGSLAASDPPVPGQPLQLTNIISPLPQFAGRAAGVGHIHISPDADGAVRRLPLIASRYGEIIPSISLQAAAAYLRRAQPYDALGVGQVHVAGRPVPTDDQYQVLINYLGPPSHRPELLPNPPLSAVSFSDVLAGTFDHSVVQDKLVFVGLTAIGFADDFWVPTSRSGVKMSGVEIHAQTAEMLLHGAYLAPQDSASTVLIILLLCVLSGAVLARSQPLLAALAAGVLWVVYISLAIVYGWLSEQQVEQATTFTVLNSVYPGLGMLFSFVTVMLYRVVFEQAEQRETRRAMGKYLSPSVMTEVLDDPTALHLGGQKREMTVLFADIRGFTSLSERTDPELLVHFLNEYLTAMTDLVFANRGVLDKYTGDGIMAFWGSPQDQPDHAELACRTAYEMRKRLQELHQRWLTVGWPALDIGVGLNTGAMTVGNVGSKMRFDYTVIGDAVNLAARLEALNKVYGTNIILGEATQRRIAHLFATRYLGRVTVRGKDQETAIYELLAPLEAASPLVPPGMLEAWDTALEAYHARRFEEASAAFQRVLELKPGDGPARLFIARCRVMASQPPDASWDAVSVLPEQE
ncbi:MAG TPA: adenylate/guanylate cyclase domain-containing protein [Chloroflexota bacterium]|nr:adenylate/guanylate cyclase domain-containing protein [Chloroflexota bacterium]